MRNLLDYLNFCLGFINDQTKEVEINGFVAAIRSSMDDMSLEQIEGFELAFEALELFYQRRMYAISIYHSSLNESSIASEDELSFYERLSKFDESTRELQCRVLFMSRVSDIINERKRELLGSSSEEKALL